jgi:lipopolysaccharide export system ATP-binding protein
MSQLLEARGLVKRYGPREVVGGISLGVESGEIVGLLGPNGAGKTTCFYMIVGLVAADGGRVYLDGHDLTDLTMPIRARLGLGYLPQEPSVFRKLSVADNVLAILETRRGLSRSGREEICHELLAELGILALRDSRALSLSGGERRRLEIARCLAAEPRCILLDEPFAGIDPLAVVDIKSIISHLRRRGIGVLITDHNVRETLDICHRAYIVNSGVVLAEGDPPGLLNNPKVRSAYLGEHFTL